MKLTRAQKKAKLQTAAEALIELLLDWDKKNTRPNLTAIEDEVLKLRQQFGQELAAMVVEGQENRQPVENPTSLTICRQIGRRCNDAIALTGLGKVACALEDYDQARQHFQAALQTAIEIHAAPQALDALVGVAQPLTKFGKVTQATKMLEYVLNHSAGTRQTKDGANHLLSTLNARLQTDGNGRNVSQLQSLEQLVADLNLSSSRSAV